MRRHPVYACLALAGLAVAAAVCLLAALFVHQELLFESFQADGDRVYRLLTESGFSKGGKFGAYTPAPAASALKKDFPEVDSAARLLPLPWMYIPTPVSYAGQADNEERFYYADPEILRILTFSFVLGDPDRALDRPGTVLLTESLAAKYFRGENPLGKVMMIEGSPAEVTGILRDAPPNTHLRYRALLSFRTIDRPADWSWDRLDPSTYIKLKAGVDARSFAGKIARLSDPYRDRSHPDSRSARYLLQPLASIHLEPLVARRDDVVREGSALFLLSLLAAVILGLACLNFVNLSTVRAAGRAKEIGVRKSIGATRLHLMRQFLTESFLLTTAAFAAGLFLAGSLLTPFNRLLGASLTMADFARPALLVIMAGLYVATGLLAGTYPAFVLASFRPVDALRRDASARLKGGRLRSVLIVFQFASAAALIAVTMAMVHQIRYMKNRPLGFDKDEKMVVSIPRQVVNSPSPGVGPGTVSSGARQASIRQELSRHSAVRSVALSQSVPGRGFPRYGVRLPSWPAARNEVMDVLFADEAFLGDYGIGLRAGRTIRTDAADREVLLNETALGSFSWRTPQEAIGQRLNLGSSEAEIVGVIRDFHAAGLQAAIRPLLVSKNPSRFNMATLTFDAARTGEVLAFVRRTWSALAPGAPLTYFFLDEDFARQYEKEDRTLGLLSVFAGLSIIIAALGLVGLAAFMAEKRTKEIGIRIVLGASPSSIVGLLIREFAGLVVWANLIAAPAALLIVHRWLRDFAYRSAPWAEMITAAAALTLAVALVAVGGQSLRAARANPVRSLRCE